MTVEIKRPLLLFGKHRPTHLLSRQLLVVRLLGASCLMLIGFGLGAYYLADLQASSVFVLRLIILFLAAAPGILLEYFLERDVRPDTDDHWERSTETLYITELLQYIFVLSLGAFLVEIAG